MPIGQWCSLDYFSPLLHQRLLAEIPLGGGRSVLDGDPAQVELQSVPGEAPSLYLYLYLYAQGDLTPGVARQLAAALLEAVDVLDQITQ